MSIFNLFKRTLTPIHPRPDPEFPEKISGQTLKNIFASCADFECREIFIGENPALRCHACYIDGIVSGSDVSGDILRPLTEAGRFSQCSDLKDCFSLIVRGAVYSASMQECPTTDEAVAAILQGCCALVFDGLGRAVCFEARTSNTRSISEPSIEKTIKGAKDAFVETLRINTSLVRRKLRHPRLKLIQTTVGRKSRTTVAVMYIDGIAKPQRVSELMRRLSSIDLDGLTATGCIEQYIVENPRSPLPQLLHTERPDKFAMSLLDGRIGLIADGLPLGFLMPATFSAFMRASESKTQNAVISSLLSVIRHVALLLSLMLPAFLVAVAMYHQEMIPTKLLLSMIQAKQSVPFSVVTEVLTMLFAFEILQEAGLRLPDPVGQTVSIIGALIVGQSAVEARVVSPIAVIVVATAGIAGFTTPSQDMGAAVRMYRFLLVIAAALGGMFGLMAVLVLIIYHMCSLENMGIAYMSPISEGRFGSLGAQLLRKPLPDDKERDPDLAAWDRRRQV